jgi:redox-sensitive bicupin YhaK (pirin superfamily)
LWLGKFEAGNRITQKIAPGRHAWLHVAEGDVSVNGTALSGGDAAALTGGGKRRTGRVETLAGLVVRPELKKGGRRFAPS